MTKIGVISLGCDKNRIDTENMLAFLEKDGYTFTGDASDADIIIVNTCAFIDSAKQESIDTILEMSDYKQTGNCKCLVVSGCLSQRYMDSLVAWRKDTVRKSKKNCLKWIFLWVLQTIGNYLN